MVRESERRNRQDDALGRIWAPFIVNPPKKPPTYNPFGNTYSGSETAMVMESSTRIVQAFYSQKHSRQGGKGDGE